MKRKDLLGLALLVSLLPSRPFAAEPETWVPTLSEVAELEAALLVAAPQPTNPGTRPAAFTKSTLQASARYYYGGFVDGVKIIKGEILTSNHEKPGVFVQSDLPIIMDGGCSVINFLYQPKSHRFVRFECNGLA